MNRTIVWLLAFSPTLAVLLVPSGERWVGLATALGILQGPVLIGAALSEAFFLKRKGMNPIAASKSGNALAAVLGIVLLVGLLWLLIQIAAANT